MLTQYSASSHQCRDLFGRWWHGNYQRPFFCSHLCLLCCAAWPSFCSRIITVHFFSPFRTYTLFILSSFWWLSLSACLGTDSFILEFCHQCTDHPYHTHIVRLNSFFNFLLFWVCVSNLDLMLWLDHLILRLFCFLFLYVRSKKVREKSMQYSTFLYVSSLSHSFCGWFRVRAATEVGFPCTVFVSMVMLTGVACTRGANAWSKPPESMFQRSAAGGRIHREADDRLEQSGVQLDIKLNFCYLAVGLEEWEITHL